jgi:hypothetical protein
MGWQCAFVLKPFAPIGVVLPPHEDTDNEKNKCKQELGCWFHLSITYMKDFFFPMLSDGPEEFG